MDPICGTIGIATGIASIVGVISKSVVALRRLHQKYQEIEFNITLVSGHLQLVNAALLQLQTFANTLSAASQHHQIVTDLESALRCCQLSVNHIYDQIAKFIANEDEGLGSAKKLLFLFEDQPTRDCLDQLNRVVNALNLFLTAFQW
jgi:hypothetical protein